MPKHAHERFIDREGDAIAIKISAHRGETVVEVGAGNGAYDICTYANAARMAAQWILDNVPAEGEPAGCAPAGPEPEPRVWEKVDEDTVRLPVPGGWIYSVHCGLTESTTTVWVPSSAEDDTCEGRR